MSASKAAKREWAKRVLAKYSPAALRDALKRYQYASNASPEDDMWESFRSRGYMTLEELVKLSSWKSRGRQVRNIRANSAQAVQIVTGAATAASRQAPDEPALPIAILTALQGVDIPTASTIMTVWDPENFAILDIRAWGALTAALGSAFHPLRSENGHRRPFRVAEVELYLEVLRELGRQTRFSCRNVDKALWVLGSNE